MSQHFHTSSQYWQRRDGKLSSAHIFSRLFSSTPHFASHISFQCGMKKQANLRKASTLMKPQSIYYYSRDISRFNPLFFLTFFCCFIVQEKRRLEKSFCRRLFVISIPSDTQGGTIFWSSSPNDQNEIFGEIASVKMSLSKRQWHERKILSSSRVN